MASDTAEEGINVVIPDGFELKQSATSEHLGIWTKRQISEGETFGPYKGQIRHEPVNSMNPLFVWEVVDDNSKRFLYYLDATDATHANWLRHVNCARFFEEQNLVSTQKEQKIYYRAIKDIHPGDELLTWFVKPDLKPRRKKKKSSKAANKIAKKQIQKREDDESNHNKPLRHNNGEMSHPVMMSTNYDNSSTDSSLLLSTTSERNHESCETNCEKSETRKLDGVSMYGLINSEVNETEKPDNFVKNDGQRPQRSSAERIKKESRVLDRKVNQSKPAGKCQALPQYEYQFEVKPVFRIKGKSGTTLYRCDICSGIYRHAFSLKRHYLRMHLNYDYLSQQDIQNCGINVNIRNRFKNIDGTEVGKNFSTVNKMRIDLYCCHICAMQFPGVSELREHCSHHKSISADKSYVCSSCPMTFTHMPNLVRHMSVHSGAKPYSCKYCSKKFPTSTNQRRHERIHEGVKPYHCSHCKSRFSQSGDLKKHIRNLHSDKFHPCPKCLKYFQSKASLSEHLQSHENAKTVVSESANDMNADLVLDEQASKVKYVCSICSKTFEHYANMCRHRRLRHERYFKPYNSPVGTGVGINIDTSFLINIAENICDNLTYFLDGKVDQIQKIAALTAAVKDENTSACDKISLEKYNFALPCATVKTEKEVTGQTEIDQHCVKEVGFLSIPHKIPAMKCGIATAQIYQCPICKVLFRSHALYSQHLRGKHNVDDTGHHESTTNIDFSTKFPLLNDLPLDLTAPSSRASCQGNMHLLPAPIRNTINCEFERCRNSNTCFVCLEDLKEDRLLVKHQLNSHPNIDFTDYDFMVTSQLCRFVSPIGLLNDASANNMLGSRREEFSCTKCSSIFPNLADFHSHIVYECADDAKQNLNHVQNSQGRQSKGMSFTRRRLLSKRRRKQRQVSIKKSLTVPPSNGKTKADVAKTEKPPKGQHKLARLEDDCIDIHKCKACDKSFSYISYLEKHLKTCPHRNEHSVEELKAQVEKQVKDQHTCPHCGRFFHYSASLRKHVRDDCDSKELTLMDATAETSKDGTPLKRKVTVISATIASAGSKILRKTFKRCNTDQNLPSCPEKKPELHAAKKSYHQSSVCKSSLAKTCSVSATFKVNLPNRQQVNTATDTIVEHVPGNATDGMIKFATNMNAFDPEAIKTTGVANAVSSRPVPVASDNPVPKRKGGWPKGKPRKPVAPSPPGAEPSQTNIVQTRRSSRLTTGSSSSPQLLPRKLPKQITLGTGLITKPKIPKIKTKAQLTKDRLRKESPFLSPSRRRKHRGGWPKGKPRKPPTNVIPKTETVDDSNNNILQLAFVESQSSCVPPI